ncbi:MAG: cyclic nucleotide-binding domain-containing protein [SAR324 cluster bacterium]|nr:cyclic nucleotide-binding domain-containing protein [SAR324 cluster bacterium]
MADLFKPSQSAAEWVLQVKDTRLFQDIPEDQLVEIAQYMEIQFLEAEQLVFTEGEVGEKIFVQLDGESSLFLGNAEKTTFLTTGTRGDCFGEMAVIDNQPRSASLKTTAPTHFLIINQSNFKKILKVGHSQFSINLMRSLSRRLRETDTLLIDMLQKENSKLESTLTLLKKTQNQLLAKERLSTLGRMASMIVHDLRNPLTSISTMGYVLTHQNLSVEQRGSYGSMLNSEINRLKEMTEEILLFAKDQSALHLIPTDLSHFFDKLKEELQQIAQSWPVEWKMKSSVASSCALDSNRLHRAFLNLCKNSWEALKSARTPSPLVQIEAYETNDHLKFVIQDNGPGIPPEIQETFFDAFVSAGKSGGTGLGLAIVKKVMEDHRGEIQHCSTGSGTLFQITLPKNFPLAT